MALHEGLGKGLGAFQLRRRLGRAKHAQAVLAKLIDDAGGQWLLGADHGQRYLFSSCPRPQRLHISDIYVLKPRIQRRSAIARCHVNRLHFGGLGQLPGQGMFTATAAHY